MAIRISWRTHRARNGGDALYARFKVPERVAGRLQYRYVEKATGTAKKGKARVIAEAYYHEAVKRAEQQAPVRSEGTFAAAAKAYMITTGKRQYLLPLIKHLGLKKLSEIDTSAVAAVIADVYPGRTAATLNRQVFTPIIAIMNFVGHRHALKRPKGHDSLPDIQVPPDEWYPAVLRAANPWLRAFLIVNRLHGRRPGELLNRTREHFNKQLGTLIVHDAKGQQSIVLQLAQPALEALVALPDLRNATEGMVKRLTWGMRHALLGTFRKETMRTWLRQACKRAGVPYFKAKEAGRHAFVTKNLQAGRSLKWVQNAGKWKTLKVVAEKYGHPELQEVDRQAKEGAEEWFHRAMNEDEENPVEVSVAKRR